MKEFQQVEMQLKYEITPREHLEMIRAVYSSSGTRAIRVCLGLLGLSLGLLSFRYMDHSLSVVIIAIFAAFTAVQFVLPFMIHRKTYYRNPRLFGIRTVTFDDEGVKSDSEIGHTEKPWSTFERFKETKNLFLSFQTKDAISIVPKRAFPTQEAITEFRSVLASKIGHR